VAGEAHCHGLSHGPADIRGEAIGEGNRSGANGKVGLAQRRNGHEVLRERPAE
jgi:hypothetical protein